MLDIYGLIKSLWGTFLSGLLPAGVPHGPAFGADSKSPPAGSWVFPADGCEV